MDKAIDKKCGCCEKSWKVIPIDAIYADDNHYAGYYWNCNCKSTLFVPSRHPKVVKEQGSESDTGSESKL